MHRPSPVPSGSPRPLTAAVYGAGQFARIGWFLGQYAATRRWLARVEGWRRPSLGGRLAGARIQAELLRRGLALLRRDLANVAAGIYPLPPGLLPRPLAAGRDAARYWRDLPAVALRRRRRRAGFAGGGEVPAGGESGLPDYFRQSFHDQTGGWLTAASAALYDTQVEVLFGGLAGAMRRQALPAIRQWLAARGATGGGDPVLLDLGTGTGAMLAAVATAFPMLTLHGLDLSPPYLDRARATLGDDVAWHRAPAEAVPLPDDSVDLVTAVYLLHELPAAVREAVLREAVRVLRPGGRLVLVDSIQLGDAPALDGLLRGFPEQFHEPYYADWIACDVPALLAGAGLTPAGSQAAYLCRRCGWRTGRRPSCAC